MHFSAMYYCIGYVDIAGPERSPAMGRQTSVGGENTLFSSQMRQYHSLDGADGCCITSNNKSLICLQLVFTSNWSNFRHAFASRGFVSVSWALKAFKIYQPTALIRSNVCQLTFENNGYNDITIIRCMQCICRVN